MKNWKIYLDNTLQKSIELKADFTGISAGSHVVKIEAYNNTTLLDTDIKNVTVHEGSYWAQTAVDTHETRVLADGGIVEDKAALKIFLEQ